MQRGNSEVGQQWNWIRGGGRGEISEGDTARLLQAQQLLLFRETGTFRIYSAQHVQLSQDQGEHQRKLLLPRTLRKEQQVHLFLIPEVPSQR